MSTLLTPSVVSEELHPPQSARTAQPSDQEGPQGDTQSCPKKCKQDVRVIVVPTMGFYISPGKSFQKELPDLAVFPQVSRQPYQGDREGRQTQWNTPPGSAAPRLPNCTAPFSIISNRSDGKHYALGSTAFCSEGKDFFLPERNFSGAFKLTPGSRNDGAGKEGDSGMILHHLLISQRSRGMARHLPMDTQQVGGRMEPRTQISLIGSHLHRDQSASCCSLLLSMLFFLLQCYG